MNEGDGDMPNESANPALGARLAEVRKERGVTQADLAKRLGVRQAMVSMIETNEAEYGEDLARRIKTFIDSGAGATQKSPRGPYKDGETRVKQRTTLPKFVPEKK
jgi:transcriptional regulator with XRE-family HTH domain